MQVILKQDLPNVGRIGELVKVKDGYARNYLIPRSLAVAASASNITQLNHQKRLVDLHKKKITKESEGTAAKLSKVALKLERRANETGKLFGGVTAIEVVEELAKHEYKLDRRDIEMEKISEAGKYAIKVRLPGDVYADVTLNVEAIIEKTEAKKGKAAGKKTSKKLTKKTDNAEAAEAAVEETDESSEA